MKKLFLACLVVVALIGCSTAGPFVTNISPVGDGKISVEKCMIQYNGFTGNITMKDCTVQEVALFMASVKE